ARGASLDHLADVGLHANVRGRGIDARDGSGDGFTSLRPVAGDDDGFEQRRLWRHGELGLCGPTRGDVHRPPLRPKADARRTDAHTARRHGAERVATVVAGECLEWRAFDLNGDAGETLARRTVDNLSSDRAGVLRGERQGVQAHQGENRECMSNEAHRYYLRRRVS